MKRFEKTLKIQRMIANDEFTPWQEIKMWLASTRVGAWLFTLEEEK